MNQNDEYYKSKYLKYKTKYIDLVESSNQNGGAIASSRLRARTYTSTNDYSNETLKKKIEARALKDEEEERLNALPKEEREQILEERRIKKENEKKIQAQKLLEFKLTKIEPLKKETDMLYEQSMKINCGYEGCRLFTENIAKVKKIIDEVNYIDQNFVTEFKVKLDEIVKKQKDCKCITLF